VLQLKESIAVCIQGGSLKEKKPIEKLSKDRKKVQKKQYIPLVKEMLAKNPKCKVKSPVCSGIAQGLHHISGRIGDKLLEKKKLFRVATSAIYSLKKTRFGRVPMDGSFQNSHLKIKQHERYRK
jgi:hypothetical protein